MTSMSSLFDCYCIHMYVAAKQFIKEMTGGGADYCFECVGMASVVHDAYASCREVHVKLLQVPNSW